MPKFGGDLDSFFKSVNRTLSLPSIIHVGVAVIDLLEKVHKSGYIYGDLKLDNLLFGNNQ